MTSIKSAPGGRGQEDDAAFLARVGGRVRSARSRQGMTRRELAQASGLSERFLAQLETGTGNVSILRLRPVASALGVAAEDLLADKPLDPELRNIVSILQASGPDLRARVAKLLASHSTVSRGRRVALIGLRGAGKSTLGRKAAESLGLAFVELNRRIEDSSGFSVQEIFSVYGDEGFRRLERQCLAEVIAQQTEVVLAVAGGIVAEPKTYADLQNSFYTIWLRAAPEEHMERVRAQGDQRPMEGNPRAMDDLKAILRRRELQYGRAHYQLDTTGLAVDEATQNLARLIRHILDGGKSD